MNSNTETLQNYLREQRVNGIKETTLKNDIAILPKLAEFLGAKPFAEASKDDMVRFIEEIMRDLEASTLHTYKVRIKKFYNRLFNLPKGQYPPSVAWIRTTNPYKGTKTKGVPITFDPEDLLTPQDILTLVESCESARDQALIMVAYETSAEAKELLAMKVKHVSFDEYGGRIALESDEGRRTIRLVDSIPFLTQWLNLHPLRKDSEAPLWVTRQHGIRGMGYDNLIRVFRHIRKRSGLKKPVSPRFLRHAGLTRMAKLLPEELLKKYAGWVQGSKMSQIYVHLTSEDLDEALLEAHDIPIKDKGKTPPSLLKPQECPRCKTVLGQGWTWCPKCGLNILRGPEIDLYVLLDKLSRDPEEMDRLIKKFGLQPEKKAAE